MNVQEIVDFLETIAPRAMKYDWDNVGLLCGSAKQEVHKILVALDPFENVCREAAQKGADLLVTHHPLIFHAPKSVTDETDVGRSILFLEQVKSRLQARGLRYVDSGKAVRRVAVGGGACADEMFTALDAGCDTFVTADVKYNEFWDAKFLGLNLIDAGHFATENPVVAVLAAKLRAAFPELPVECAENHHDCANFF